MGKKMVFLLALLMAGTVQFAIAGGGSDNTASSSSGIVEIEFFNMNQAWTVPNWGVDAVTARITERTGIRMKPGAPQGDWQQIANLWLASRDYPEMMHMSSTNVVFNQYIEAGALHAINRLADQYNYPKIMSEYIYPTTRRYWTKPDGNMYLAPSWFSDDGFGSVGEALNVRNDLYKQFGEPRINSMSDLYQYMIRIRDANLTASDGSKLWAFSFGSTDNQYIAKIANAWGSKIVRFNYIDEASRSIRFFLRNPTVTSALQWLGRALREGLMDPDTLTFDSTSRSAAYSNHKYGVIFDWFWNMWSANALGMRQNPDMWYKAIPVPAGTPGVQPFHGRYHVTGTSGTMVTRNAKNPAAAIKFLDFMLSPEGQILNFYGIEGPMGRGTMYYDANRQPWLHPEAYSAYVADTTGYRAVHGIRIWDFQVNAKYNWERTQEDPQRQANRLVAQQSAFEGSLQEIIVIDALTPEGMLLAEIQSTINSQLIRILQEPNDQQIAQAVQNLLAEYERRGVGRLEEAWTRMYREIAR